MEAQGQNNGVKYLIICIAGLIAILVAVKQLGFTPTEITTPGVSLKLSGGLAPKAGQQSDPPAAQDSAKLEARIHELESQQRSAPQQAPVPANVVSRDTIPPQSNQTANVGGTWVGQLIVVIRQNGTSIGTQTYNLQRALVSVGSGTINGRTLQVTYRNYLNVPGTVTATISPDGNQLYATDYGGPNPESYVFTRSQ